MTTCIWHYELLICYNRFFYTIYLTMFKLLVSIFRGINTFWAWLSTALKQTTLSYCEIQTADSRTVLVANDGSLVTILRIEGVQMLIGREEFERILNGLKQS